MSKNALTFRKPLIYIRNNKGPIIEPYGTPVVINFVTDFALLYSTY